jgi:hypothetical protein
MVTGLSVELRQVSMVTPLLRAWVAIGLSRTMQSRTGGLRAPLYTLSRPEHPPPGGVCPDAIEAP